jgi:hypothetical protein
MVWVVRTRRAPQLWVPQCFFQEKLCCVWGLVISVRLRLSATGARQKLQIFCARLFPVFQTVFSHPRGCWMEDGGGVGVGVGYILPASFVCLSCLLKQK